MARPDLLALSPESVAALSNRGLVNRAEREIAAGDGPTLEEDEEGVVTGRFSDGTVASLVPGLSLRDSPCTCGAAAVCRHRVAIALSYAKWALSASAPPLWSPGAISDADLERALGKRVLERARAARADGVVIEIRRGARPSGGASPAARLPTCGVRFLVPHDLTYAQCDCAGKAACEHIALAVWAFRQADEADPGAPIATVELAGPRAKGVDLRPLDGALELARHILLEGIARVSPGILAPRFASARAALLRAGLVWPAEILDDIEIAVRAYHERSARYSSSAAAALFTELYARARAAARAAPEPALPARHIVGADEAAETPLERAHLVSIGARVDALGARADVLGRARVAEIYLADPSSGIVLVYSIERTFADDEPLEEGPELAKQRVLRKFSLGALASGQLVSRDVVRLANRRLRLRRAGAQTSVTPQTGALGSLPEPLLVRDLAALERSQRELPPRFLRPRVLTEAVRVIAVGSVSDVVYRPGDQELTAEIRGEGGGSIVLARAHRRAAPFAIDAIASALSSPLALRFVSGFVRLAKSGAGLEIDPILLVTDRVIVPDIEPERPLPMKLRTASGSRRAASPIDAALELSSSCLTEACHSGLLRASVPSSSSRSPRERSGWGDRAMSAATSLDDAGLSGVAERIRAVVARVREASLTDAAGAWAAAADAWMTAQVRVALAMDARSPA